MISKGEFIVEHFKITNGVILKPRAEKHIEGEKMPIIVIV